MKIVGLFHKKGSKVEDLFTKLKRYSRGSNIIIAPDYALQVNPTRLNTDEEYNYICEFLEGLSLETGSLIIPGTLPHSEEGKTMVLQSPVFNRGNIRILNKETDRGEDDFAKSQGLTYKRDVNKFLNT